MAEYFRKLGLEVRTGYAKTGVIGILKGGKPGPIVAMRGDMDALPITEETGLPFASKEKAVVDGRETGLMHACGHDIHTTVLLGVAAVLTSVKADLPGTVVFIAQPAEECCGGADMMIREGAFKDIVPGAFFAYHVDDTLKAGRIGYASGFMSANVDGFSLEIRSEGCHGASPWSCVDPIVVGAQVVTALQTIVSRETNVWNNTVITVGSFHAGSAPNIVPRSARLEATVRNYGEDQRRILQEKVTRLVTGICQAAGAPFDLAYEFGTLSVYNDPALVRGALATAERVLGSKDGPRRAEARDGRRGLQLFRDHRPGRDAQPRRRPRRPGIDSRPLPDLPRRRGRHPHRRGSDGQHHPGPPDGGGQKKGPEITPGSRSRGRRAGLKRAGPVVRIDR